MPDAYTGYRYVRNKRLVTFVARSLAPPPPDFNVEPAWLEGSGFEVRNKCLVYVKAVVAPKRRFNIEIGGEGGRVFIHQSKLRFRYVQNAEPYLLANFCPLPVVLQSGFMQKNAIRFNFIRYNSIQNKTRTMSTTDADG